MLETDDGARLARRCSTSDRFAELTWEATSHRTYMPSESLLERVIQLLGSLRSDHGFSISTSDVQTSLFGAWVRLESHEFFVDVIRDRSQEWLEVTSQIRPRPRAPRRGWPLGPVLAYLNGAADPYPN